MGDMRLANGKRETGIRERRRLKGVEGRGEREREREAVTER